MTKRYPYNVLASVSLSVLALVAVPAQAQDVDESTIVVTARRVEERLQDVPISITVFNQQQITNRNIVSAGDLATYTPSLSTNGRWGPENTSFSIRGFVQEGPTSPSVGVYFGEVVALRANGGSTAGNGAGVGALFDLANVQVLKGPQGTLFGRNTTGGAVLLVPQKPTGKFEGYVEGSVGNYDMKRIQAVVNIPVMDTLRVRVGVDRQTRDGYLRNVSPVGPRDFADIDYTAVRFSAVADLTPNLENYTIVSYGYSNTNGNLPRMAAITNPAAYRVDNYRAQIAQMTGNYYNVSNGNPDPHQRIEQWQAINTTTWRASDTMTFKNIVSYGEYRQALSNNNNGDNGYDPTTNPASYNYAIAVINDNGKYNVSQSTFTEELQLQGRSSNDRLNYQLGAYLELSEPLNGYQSSRSPIFLNCTDVQKLQCIDLRGRLTSDGAGGNLEGRVGQMSLSRSKYSFRNLGLYAQGTYKLTDTISITGGIRYTSDITRGVGDPLRVFFPTTGPRYACAQPANIVNGPIPTDPTAASAAIQANPDLCKYTRRVSSSKPTWLIDVDFKPVDDVLIYAKYARGYRQGSVNVSSYGLETWGPEKVDTYEIGAKTSFDSFVKGTFNIAAFYNDFSNQQLQLGTIACTATDLVTNPVQCPFVASPAAGIANAGKSTIKGVEIDASIRPFAGFSVDVSYAHLDTKLKSATKPAIPLGFTNLTLPAVGGPLALAPKNKYSITGNYTLPLADNIGRMTFSATFSHQDSALGNTSSPVSLQTLPSQDQLNLNFNWAAVAGGPVDLGLFVTNLTKEKFHLFTTGGSNGFDALILNQPRMWGARLRYRFGN
ncbi:MAG TPA: TonB-dependent receptor [Sphingobium sp.]|uniref:TonB-dependent receptor n=1 Tax=Sphingobium sp. TaxID=1912891 RepID=UPI002ED117DB